MNKIAIFDRALLAGLAFSALIIFAYNQNTDVKDVALICLGGLIGYLRQPDREIST